ncbi:MAG: hypothetical protein WD824_04445 [Cyclobacteriaceae bacterium]
MKQQKTFQAQFNISPDGKMLALIADNSIWLTDMKTGEASRITPKSPDADAPVVAVLWNHAGNMLVYNRHVEAENERYLQILKINLN